MDDHIYKQVELTGFSRASMEEAIQNAITKAGESLRNIHWFQVIDTPGYVADNKVDHWQVRIKLGFRLENCQSLPAARHLLVISPCRYWPAPS